MSTQSIPSRPRREIITIMLSLLGGLLLSLQLVLPAPTYAASPRAASTGYTFGNSQPMDLASVAVVRLVVSTILKSPALPKPCATGLGVIVSSDATSSGGGGTPQGPYYNTVLTDGPLLTCGTSIAVYANAAYTNNTATNATLAALTCNSTLKTCETTSITSSTTTFPTTCQSASACTKGVILLPFVTTNQQPLMTTASASTPSSFHIQLGNASDTEVAPLTNPTGNLVPFTTDQQVRDNAVTATATPAQAFDVGTPLVNAAGQLVSIHTSNGDITIASLTQLSIPSSPADQLQTAWAKEVRDFYTENYSAVVSQDVQAFGTLNPTFAAATALKTVASSRVSQSTTSTKPPPKKSSPQGNIINNPLVLLAIVGLIVMILLLLLISFAVAHGRRVLAQFEKEQEAVSRTANLDAQRIRMEEAARRVAEPPQKQLILPPVQKKDSPEKKAIAIDSDSYRRPEISCPNCHQLVRANARFCTNCRFPLKPVQEDHVVKTPIPRVAEQLEQERLSVPRIPVQLPREEKQEQDNVLSIQKKAENDKPPNVIEAPLQEAVLGDENEEEEAGRVGQQFGNYKLLRYLGEGGFAEVYLGEHIHLGSYAAIKILSGRLTGEEQERFRLEARTLVRLVHPHIVRLLEFGIEDKVPFLVMDYAVNGTLRQRHHKGSRVPLPLVVNYVKQAADALQFAHDQKFIHRDIKPENMLVGSHNEILLSDFGIAIVAQSSRYQNPQNMAGTVSYMAPEQIQLHPRPASDQYSLGIVTYEWLCGSRPFQGSFTEIAVKHATISPTPLRQKASTIPLSVEQVVMKSLAKDPKERFESVQAFAFALEQASSL